MLLIGAPDLIGGDHRLRLCDEESEAQMGQDSGNWGIYSGTKIEEDWTGS